MKINLSVLALASILVSSSASASHVSVDSDQPGNKPVFDFADARPDFEFKEHSQRKQPGQPVFDFPGRFNPHQGYELAGLRNLHAEGKGSTGLNQATIQVSAVPLPAAGWLFLSGLVGMIATACRKRHYKR